MKMYYSVKDFKRSPSLLDLLWEDVLFSKVLPCLSIKDLFILRGLSSKYKLLIDTYFKRMTCLHIGPFCKIFNVDAFKVLLKHCRQLREVIVANCSWLTDELVIALFENNSNLTKIVLNHCNGLTSVCLQPVIINCKSLKCLSLAGCSWLTVGCLQSITLHQHNLVEVDISACLMIDKLETINNFLIISHKIKILNMSKIACVNDSTLAVLARSAKQLESLSVSECYKVTGYGISLVIEYCRSLKGVMCVGCPLVSSQTVRAQHRPNLLIIPAPASPAGGLRILLPRLNGINV